MLHAATIEENLGVLLDNQVLYPAIESNILVQNSCHGKGIIK